MNRQANIFLTVLLLGGASAFAEEPPVKESRAKNLQVLPKNITRAELQKLMRAENQALGVECVFCHDAPDMAADTKETKVVARRMMQMTDELNDKWFGDKKGVPQHIGCVTCHRGEAAPPAP